MKITIYSHIFYPEMATINEVASKLVERGHEVTVITGIPNAPLGKIYEGYGFFQRLREDWKGVKIRRNWQIPRGSASSLRLVINYISYVLSGSLASIRMARTKPDLILVNALSPITVALPAIVLRKFTKAPLAMWIHDLWPESVSASGAITNERIVDRIGYLVDFIYRHCDLLFIQSQAMRDSVEERNVESDRIVFFPNPIDSLYQPLDNPARPDVLSSVLSGAFVVMFAGSIGVSQDMPTILAAADKLRDKTDIHWVIVGGGRNFEQTKALTKKLGLEDRVHFVGSHPPSSMPSFFYYADLLLVTLRDEPILALTVPLKTQTYMACARPIVCNVRGEAARIVNEAKAGFTAPPEDPDALSKAVLQAYKIRGAELEQLGRNARAYFEKHYAQEKIMDKLETNLYQLVEAGITGQDRGVK